MPIKKSQSKHLSKPALVAAAVIIIVGLTSWWYLKSRDSRASVTTPDSASQQNGVDLSPATEEEKQETDDHKQDLGNPTQTPVVDSAGKVQVAPVITNADQTEVRAFVPGVAEDGGTCTAYFSRGAFSFSKQSSGFSNVNTTTCEPIRLERSDFAQPGDWKVTLTYSSTKAAGSSQVTTFQVD